MHTRVVFSAALALVALPAQAQDRDRVAILLAVTPEGTRAIAGNEMGLLSLLRKAVTVHTEGQAAGEVVLFVARLAKGEVVAHGSSTPFRLDPRATSQSTGMLLGRLVGDDHVAPLKPAEFLVAGQKEITGMVNAAELLADPLGWQPGQPEYGSHVAIVAIVPADPPARRRASVRPLVLTSSPLR